MASARHAQHHASHIASEGCTGSVQSQTRHVLGQCTSACRRLAPRPPTSRPAQLWQHVLELQLLQRSQHILATDGLPLGLPRYVVGRGREVADKHLGALAEGQQGILVERHVALGVIPPAACSTALTMRFTMDLGRSVSASCFLPSVAAIWVGRSREKQYVVLCGALARLVLLATVFGFFRSSSSSPKPLMPGDLGCIAA